MLLYDVFGLGELLHELREFLVTVVVELLSDSALTRYWYLEVQLGHVDSLRSTWCDTILPLQPLCSVEVIFTIVLVLRIPGLVCVDS